MFAFRFLYLGLLIGTAFALPIHPRSEFDDVYITLREPSSGDNLPHSSTALALPRVNPLFARQLLRADAYIYLQKVGPAKGSGHSEGVSLLFPGQFMHINPYFSCIWKHSRCLHRREKIMIIWCLLVSRWMLIFLAFGNTACLFFFHLETQSLHSLESEDFAHLNDDNLVSPSTKVKCLFFLHLETQHAYFSSIWEHSRCLHSRFLHWIKTLVMLIRVWYFLSELSTWMLIFLALGNTACLFFLHLETQPRPAPIRVSDQSDHVNPNLVVSKRSGFRVNAYFSCTWKHAYFSCIWKHSHSLHSPTIGDYGTHLAT